MSVVVTVVLGVIYVAIVVTSIVGNSVLISVVIRNKDLRKPVYLLLANASLSDLLFTILTLADAAYFLLGEWIFGDVICRIQGAFVEISFTISMLSFAVIAVERYISICRLTSNKVSVNTCIKLMCAAWLVSILVCSPLFYGYHVSFEDQQTDDVTAFQNVTICTVNNWSMEAGMIYYSIHTVLIYITPLIIMVVTHSKIAKMLRESEKPILFSNCSLERSNSQESSSNNCEDPVQRNRVYSEAVARLQEEKLAEKRSRNRKVIRLCVVVTTVFFLIWTPYIIVRIIWHTTLDLPEVIWKLVQLLTLSSTAVNFFIYAVMSPVLRQAFINATCPCRKVESID